MGWIRADDGPRGSKSLRFPLSLLKRPSVSVEFTAVYQAVPEGFIAFVEELPGANTQGATLDETRANLREAVLLVMEANRAMAEEDLAGATVIRERLRLTA